MNATLFSCSCLQQLGIVLIQLLPPEATHVRYYVKQNLHILKQMLQNQ